MKSEIRVLGIDDSPFKIDDKEVLVIGTVFRGGEFMDGVMSCRVEKDGEDATGKISSMINKSKFRVQLRAIMLDGIAVGGFNIIDVEKLHANTKIPVIIIMRTYPMLDKMRKALIDLGMKGKLKLLDSAGSIYAFDNIHYQCIGFAPAEAEKIIKLTSTHSFIPEPLRAAHLIGAGIILGESKGRA